MYLHPALNRTRTVEAARHGLEVSFVAAASRQHRRNRPRLDPLEGVVVFQLCGNAPRSDVALHTALAQMRAQLVHGPKLVAVI